MPGVALATTISTPSPLHPASMHVVAEHVTARSQSLTPRPQPPKVRFGLPNPASSVPPLVQHGQHAQQGLSATGTSVSLRAAAAEAESGHGWAGWGLGAGSIAGWQPPFGGAGTAGGGAAQEYGAAWRATPQVGGIGATVGRGDAAFAASASAPQSPVARAVGVTGGHAGAPMELGQGTADPAAFAAAYERVQGMLHAAHAAPAPASAATRFGAVAGLHPPSSGCQAVQSGARLPVPPAPTAGDWAVQRPLHGGLEPLAAAVSGADSLIAAQRDRAAAAAQTAAVAAAYEGPEMNHRTQGQRPAEGATPDVRAADIMPTPASWEPPGQRYPGSGGQLPVPAAAADAASAALMPIGFAPQSATGQGGTAAHAEANGAADKWRDHAGGCVAPVATGRADLHEVAPAHGCSRQHASGYSDRVGAADGMDHSIAERIGCAVAAGAVGHSAAAYGDSNKWDGGTGGLANGGAAVPDAGGAGPAPAQRCNAGAGGPGCDLRAALNASRLHGAGLHSGLGHDHGARRSDELGASRYSGGSVGGRGGACGYSYDAPAADTTGCHPQGGSMHLGATLVAMAHDGPAEAPWQRADGAGRVVLCESPASAPRELSFGHQEGFRSQQRRSEVPFQYRDRAGAAPSVAGVSCAVAHEQSQRVLSEWGSTGDVPALISSASPEGWPRTHGAHALGSVRLSDCDRMQTSGGVGGSAESSWREEVFTGLAMAEAALGATAPEPAGALARANRPPRWNPPQRRTGEVLGGGGVQKVTRIDSAGGSGGDDRRGGFREVGQERFGGGGGGGALHAGAASALQQLASEPVSFSSSVDLRGSGAMF